MLNKKSSLVYVVLFALFLTLVFSACQEKEPPKKELTQEELIEHGKFLVEVGGCTDCHTPKVFGPNGPVPDETKFLSGHPQDAKLAKFDPSILQPGGYVLFTQDITAAVGPWGASFAANLTPDMETGIGSWQPEMFINAMKTGKHLGAGRPILPPMPWQNLSILPEEELRAMFAYLKSISPVKNKVPDPISLEDLISSK